MRAPARNSLMFLLGPTETVTHVHSRLLVHLYSGITMSSISSAWYHQATAPAIAAVALQTLEMDIRLWKCFGLQFKDTASCGKGKQHFCWEHWKKCHLLPLTQLKDGEVWATMQLPLMIFKLTTYSQRDSRTNSQVKRLPGNTNEFRINPT